MGSVLLLLRKCLAVPVFLVSLDFEGYWGIRDKRSIASYREWIVTQPKLMSSLEELRGKGVQEWIPLLLFRPKVKMKVAKKMATALTGKDYEAMSTVTRFSPG